MKTSSTNSALLLTLVKHDSTHEKPIEFRKFSAARNYCRSRIGEQRIFSHGLLKQPNGTTTILKP